MAKTTHVVLTVKSRGQEIGDVVAVEPERAEELIASGLARAVRSGEVKAATEGK